MGVAAIKKGQHRMRGLLRVLFPVQRRCVVRAAITGFPRVPRRTMSTNIYAKLPKVTNYEEISGLLSWKLM